MAQFTVGANLAGQTLRDIRSKGNLAFRTDILAGFGGIDENTALREGQVFNIQDQGSAEFQEASKLFQTSDQVQAGKQKAFGEAREAKNEAFLKGVREIPTQLQAVREEIGIPGAFERVSTAGGELQTALEASRDLPGQERQAGREFGLTENQLAQIIAQKQKEAQPGLETKARASERAGFDLQNLLQAFQGRSEEIFNVAQIEQGVLGAENAELFANFRQQTTNDLNRELAQLSATTQLSISEANRLNELAKLEATLQTGTIINTGTQILLRNPVTGELISSDDIKRFPKEKTPSILDTLRVQPTQSAPGSFGSGTVVIGGATFDVIN